MKNIILTDKEITHKTKRIAYQIYETFVNEEEVVLAGITTNGYIFAKKIGAELNAISEKLETSPLTESEKCNDKNRQLNPGLMNDISNQLSNLFKNNDAFGFIVTKLKTLI